jgi:hypothetical protein
MEDYPWKVRYTGELPDCNYGKRQGSLKATVMAETGMRQ